MKPVDVIVVGGGPAGAAAAIALTSSGVAVTVLERSAHKTVRVGETLSPAAKPWLQRLGIWNDFLADAHLPSPGIVSVWGPGPPYETDFIRSPYGSGWHLDRTRFDRTMLTCAERAGARIIRSTRIASCTLRPQGVWQVAFEHLGKRHQENATYLLDATGRSAWLAQHQGVRRNEFDQLVGVVGFGEATKVHDLRMILEATAVGWWYSAHLPHGRVVSALMTDADLLPRGQSQLMQFWYEQRRKSPLTAAHWSHTTEVCQLHTRFSGTVRLERVWGPGWLAIGDAAMAFDPLSSQGILKAIESGVRAAGVVIAALDGSAHSQFDYSQWLDLEFLDYRHNYAFYYGQIIDWRDATFWKRRQS